MPLLEIHWKYGPRDMPVRLDRVMWLFNFSNVCPFCPCLCLCPFLYPCPYLCLSLCPYLCLCLYPCLYHLCQTFASLREVHLIHRHHPPPLPPPPRRHRLAGGLPLLACHPFWRLG